MVRIADYMERDAVTVAPGDSAAITAQRMLTTRHGLITVCEGGRFLGAITERDIIARIVATGRDPLTERAGGIMNKRVPVVSPDDDIWVALTLMVEGDLKAIPVVEKGIFKGVFTLEHLAHESPALAAMVFTRTARKETAREVKV